MITEDYVSFETAKLLKEKGFMEGAIIKFFASGYDSKGNILDIRDTELKDYPRPTLQMAIKWLRETHNWAICISPYWPEGDMRNKLTWDFTIHSLIDNRIFRECSYTDNYEQAHEAAIKYCLENLI